MVTYGQTGHGGLRSGMDHQQDRMGFPIDVLFDFQHMYISRKGDTVRSPQSGNQLFSTSFKSELSVLLHKTVAVQAPTTYVEPSTPSHANSLQGIQPHYLTPGTPPTSSVTVFPDCPMTATYG